MKRRSRKSQKSPSRGIGASLKLIQGQLLYIGKGKESLTDRNVIVRILYGAEYTCVARRLPSYFLYLLSAFLLENKIRNTYTRHQSKLIWVKKKGNQTRQTKEKRPYQFLQEKRPKSEFFPVQI